MPTYRSGESVLTGTNPLGKYAEAVSAIVAVAVIFAAVAMHAYSAFVGVDLNTTFVDNVALIAVGVLFGGKAVANGAKEAVKEPILQLERQIHAAHTRLDTIEAPPADNNATNETKG